MKFAERRCVHSAATNNSVKMFSSSGFARDASRLVWRLLMRKFHRMLAAVTLAAGLAPTAPALAQEYIVNGDMWLSSTLELRRAFLVGAANMIALETAYAKKKGTPQPAVGVLAAQAAKGMTLDQIIDRI